MKIQVFGPGCSKCKTLEKNALAAVSELQLDAEVEKVTDMQKMMAAGVLSTPALAIDGTVKAVGKVSTTAEIKAMLQA